MGANDTLKSTHTGVYKRSVSAYGPGLSMLSALEFLLEGDASLRDVEIACRLETAILKDILKRPRLWQNIITYRVTTCKQDV
jgi:hypothetical protein